MKVYVTGQKAFGAAVAEAVIEAGYDLVGAASPAFSGVHAPLTLALGDQTLPGDRLRRVAEAAGVPWIEAARFTAQSVPTDTDVIVAAHSHAFVSRKARARARVASIGYHPSLLPLHRGRDAVRWTVRDGDRITGGSVYHLTDTVDGGPIAAQDWRFVPPGSTAESLWRDVLFPLGLDLVRAALADLATGLVVCVPQDERLATWEPSWERPRLHRPELPALPGAGDDGLRYSGDPALLHR